MDRGAAYSPEVPDSLIPIESWSTEQSRSLAENMSLIILQFGVSAPVIVIGGTYLTRYADAIADLTGLGRLLVGRVLSAGATSLPKLSMVSSRVSLDAKPS